MAWPSIYNLHNQNLNPTNSPSAREKPVILIAHDAFHAASHFQPLATRLTQLGFRVLTPQLPSSNFAVQPNALESDVRALVTAAVPHIDQSRDVMLVAHGYGAVPGCIAADRLNQYSLDRPRAGRVVKQILIAGVVLEADECYNDVLEHPWMNVQAEQIFPRNGTSTFFHDVSPVAQIRSASTLRPQSANAFSTPVPDPGWHAAPTLYILCEHDQAMPPAAQRLFLQILVECEPQQTRHVLLPGGHSPYLARVEELAGWVFREA